HAECAQDLFQGEVLAHVGLQAVPPLLGVGGQQVLVGGVVVIGPVGEHVDDAGALVLQDVVVLLLPGLLGEDLRHLVQQVAVGLIPGVVAAVAVAVLELLRQGLAGGGLVVV